MKPIDFWVQKVKGHGQGYHLVRHRGFASPQRAHCGYSSNLGFRPSILEQEWFESGPSS